MEKSKYQNRSKVIWAKKSYQTKNSGKKAGVLGRYSIKKIILSAGSAFLFFGVLGAAGYFLLFSDSFMVSSIDVNGLQTIPKDDVLSEANAILEKKRILGISSRNYFLLPSGELTASISEKFPKIDSVMINKDGIRRAVLELRERQVAGVWCRGRVGESGSVYANSECLYFDKSGIIFEYSPKSSGSIVFSVVDFRDGDKKLGEKVLDPELIKDMEEISGIISKNFSFGVREFTISQGGEFEVVTSENWNIRLGQGERRGQFSNLKYVLDEEIKEKRHSLEYIDLRLGNRVYYKFVSAP